MLPLCSSSGFLASFYFTFCSRDFFFEHQAILKARVAYKKNKGMQSSSSALLRRNIHRLEKGLIMRPRRNIFALDYLPETINTYERATLQQGFSESELQWAKDILTEYFTVVDKHHPVIASSYAQFRAIHEQLLVTHKKPYQQADKVKHNISYEQLTCLVQARRSTRWFNSQTVEQEKIEQAVNIALQAPSACNRQPYEFYVIQNQPLLSKLANLPGGTTGFADNIPCLIAVVGDLSYYPESRDRHVIYIDGSLASMQFMLALETLGLGSCPINWPELYMLDKKVTKLLNLPHYKRVVMFIAVGYPDKQGQIAYSDKKRAQDTIIKL